ncbi:GxxExxY protein [uncultured Ilyobacter sp.]|uniref:GxxExxY protein n=1 Tax=uncultured Ilyobacter sp. TaxID=544433 RepID=UPI0029F48DAA|nr:GxxExxY protein [uncultured Ilyobacter sp.]
MTKYLYEDLTEKIIKCFYKVYDELGFGFLESVYEAALVIELQEMGLKIERQKELEVFYKGISIGKYRSDIIVENKIIIELKSTSNLSKIHEVQLVNYLKATNIEIGLLVNFGEKLTFKRKIFRNK